MSLTNKPIYPSTEKFYERDAKEPNKNIGQFFIPNEGITLRQYYAGLAMQGLLASSKWGSPDELGETSVNIADALIAELEKQNATS